MNGWRGMRLAVVALALTGTLFLLGCPTGGGGAPPGTPGSTGIRIPSSYVVELSGGGVAAHRITLQSPSVATNHPFEVIIASTQDPEALGSLAIDTSQSTGVTLTRAGTTVTIVQPEGAASIGTFRTIATGVQIYPAAIATATLVLNFSEEGNRVTGSIDATTTDTVVPQELRTYQRTFAGNRE